MRVFSSTWAKASLACVEGQPRGHIIFSSVVSLLCKSGTQEIIDLSSSAEAFVCSIFQSLKAGSTEQLAILLDASIFN
jgi:hypothetical protein